MPRGYTKNVAGASGKRARGGGNRYQPRMNAMDYDREEAAVAGNTGRWKADGTGCEKHWVRPDGRLLRLRGGVANNFCDMRFCFGTRADLAGKYTQSRAKNKAALHRLLKDTPNAGIPRRSARSS